MFNGFRVDLIGPLLSFYRLSSRCSVMSMDVHMLSDVVLTMFTDLHVCSMDIQPCSYEFD